MTIWQKAIPFGMSILMVWRYYSARMFRRTDRMLAVISLNSTKWEDFLPLLITSKNFMDFRFDVHHSSKRIEKFTIRFKPQIASNVGGCWGHHAQNFQGFSKWPCLDCCFSSNKFFFFTFFMNRYFNHLFTSYTSHHYSTFFSKKL